MSSGGESSSGTPVGSFSTGNFPMLPLRRHAGMIPDSSPKGGGQTGFVTCVGMRRDE